MLRSRKSVLTVTLALCLSLCALTAWASDPVDALSARPGDSVYAVLRLEDLGGFLRWAASEGNLKPFAPLAGFGDEEIQFLTSVLAEVPVTGAALACGMTADMTPFLQLALALPAELQPKLDLVANGTAKAEDVAALLVGNSPVAVMAPMALELKSEGGVVTLNDLVVLSAKDNLLLIGLTPSDVKASAEAVESGERRLALKRRFAARDCVLLHLDFDTASALAKAAEDEDMTAAFGELREYFRAPLDVELNFESLAGRFLVSAAMNLREALTEKYAAGLDKGKPVPGGHIRLLGGRSPMLAMGMTLNSSALKEQPATKDGWKAFVKGLGMLGVTEEEFVKLVNGGVSLAAGGNFVSLEGVRVPGLVLALEGQDGVAVSLTGRLAEKEKAHLNPIQSEGWDSLLQLDSSISPVPCLVGAKGETFFAGVIGASSLTATPEPTPRLAELLRSEAVSSLYLDFETFRSYLKEELDGPLGAMLPFLAAMAGDEVSSLAPLVKDALDVKLSVPSFSFWSPDGETLFLDFAVVDVPPEEGLWARAAKICQELNKPSAGEEKEGKDED